MPNESEPRDARGYVGHVHWGPLGTVLWGALIAVVVVLAQAITVVVYMIRKGVFLSHQAPAAVNQLQYDGFLLSACTFVSAIVSCTAIAGVVKLKRGSNIREYLGLNLPNKRQFVSWFLIVLAFVILSDGLSFLIGEPIVPEFMSKTYDSLNSPWILWLALLVAAPLSEEVFFRGFLIKGLSASVVRWYGAVIISSAAWAAIHLQYDLYGVAMIFVLGLLLGAARVKTGSVILTMVLHSFTNFEATVEVVIHLRRLFG
jgi:membrane protease YdiL (CAAX protease family)